MPRLDKKLPHGVIHGAFEGARYQQGEHYYSEQEAYLFSLDVDNQRYVVPSAQAPGPTPAASSTQEANTNTKPAAKDAVDLSAWARGDVKLAWAKVRKAIAAEYPDVDTRDAATARKGLALHGIG